MILERILVVCNFLQSSFGSKFVKTSVSLSYTWLYILPSNLKGCQKIK